MLLVIGPAWDYWIHEKTAYFDFQWSMPAGAYTRPLFSST